MSDRESLRDALVALPFVAEVPPSGGNFLLIQLEGSDSRLAGQIRDRLLERYNMEIKNVTGRFPDGVPRLRVAVRTKVENALLVGALRDLCEEILAIQDR